MSLVGLNIGTHDSLSAKTRRYADYYRQLAAGTIKDVYDDETVELSSCFYRSDIETASFPVCKSFTKTGTFIFCFDLRSVHFPELVTFGEYAFSETTKLSYVFFPKVTSVSKGAFQRSGVETIDLPAARTIHISAFDACTKLRELKIPVCTLLANGAFYNCTALEKIFLDGVTAVTTLGANALKNTPETLKIIVPDALVDSFKTATNWSTYADRIIGVTEYDAMTTS